MLLRTYNSLYKLLLPLVNQLSAETTHSAFIGMLRLADQTPPLVKLARAIGNRTQPTDPVTVGGVDLPSPLILSAGLVKGDGFADESTAMVQAARRNIIPGWRTMPALAGPVEFGSFTRYPREGNTGTVIWRRANTRSTQNRIGLKNPGALAAAGFLAKHQPNLSHCGVNIAVSPGVTDREQERREAVEAVEMFLNHDVRPAWFTLNLSCPNTEDDPSGNQTTDKAQDLCGTLVQTLAGVDVPLWVKVGPGLSDAQYAGLIAAFTETGVRAVIATNTLAQPTPDEANVAGVGGGELHAAALHAVSSLNNARAAQNADIDIIGCGGLMDGPSYRAFRRAGANAFMYYSALIFRGPLAAAIIHREGELA